MMKKILISSILFLIIFIGIAGASTPLLPDQFSGNVYVNGAQANPGTVIVAKIGANVVGTVTTSELGKYGDTDFNKLLVSGQDTDVGSTITFEVGGLPAQETATFIGNQLVTLNLHAFGVVPTNPTVTAVTPSSGVVGTTVIITNLAGTNFVPGSIIPTAVTLVSGGNLITATNVNVVSTTKITCTIPIPGAATPGYWDVTVTNPDGQFGTLPSGFTVSPAAAKPITIIQPGGTLFIGEQGLNVVAAMAGATKIAWFGGKDPSKDSPTQILSIDDPNKFDVNPSSFANPLDPTLLMTGPWYRWNNNSPAGAVAFVVQDPQLSIQFYDPSGPIGTGDTRYLGTLLNFRIVSNLFPITQRAGVDPVTDSFMSISVQNPNNILYNELFLSPTVTPNTKSLLKLQYQQPTYFWTNQLDFIHYWFTNAKDSRGFYQYPTGYYSAWATATANNMNQTYPIVGKTISVSKSVNLVPETVTVTTNQSVTRSNNLVATIHGRPNAQYYLWVKTNECSPMSGNDCDQPPMISPGQKNVQFDPVSGPYAIGNTLMFPAGCLPNTTIRGTVPKIPDAGIRYYALVTTDIEGDAWVQFETTTATAIKTFDMHVQGLGLDGLQKYDDTTFTVNQGEVTIVMNSTAILGDKVKISGTNTDSYTTYLYLTGPCQPQCGANLTSPTVPLNSGSYTLVQVMNSGRTWEYNPDEGGWDTSKLPITTGEYTIYATSKPVDACDKNPCTARTTSKITLNAPTIEATITGDPVVRDCCTVPSLIIKGKTTGNSLHQVSMWIFGDKKMGDVHYIHTYIQDCCGDFTINLADPKYGLNLNTLPAGKYYVVLQHPMYNHQFDIIVEGDFNGIAPYSPPSTLINEPNEKYVVSSSPIKWSKEFIIAGADAKLEKAGYDALIQTFPPFNPSIDDKIINLNFSVKDANAPTAAFIGYPTSGSKPLVVQFQDQSTGLPTSWAWDFGDGSTSTDQNPAHEYKVEKDYSVTLTVSKIVNQLTASDSITKDKYIHVGGTLLEADFAPQYVTGLKPFTVQFTDKTTGSPTQWTWNFGDGGFAIDQNPTHTYTEAGSYTVTLTARNLEQTDTLPVTNCITVTSSPTPPPVDPSKITLNPGWNFVSTPKTLASGYNTGAIFANVDMGGHSAYIWDGAMSPPQWVPVISTTPIRPLYGIWIYSVSNTVVNLNFDTNLITPPTRNLPAGWNSIGFTGVTQQSAHNTYLSVKPNWTTSMGFNAVTQKYDPTIFNDNPSDLTVLSPTKGYWLYMMTPGNLAAIGA